MLQRCTSNTATSLSLLFPMDYEGNYYSSTSTSVVDCTLSLGTPSTRQSTPSSNNITQRSTTPSFCWDNIINNTSQYSKPSTASVANSNMIGGDPVLLARRCANCDTTSTPLWRNGPRGPKSLCNACGIRYKKEERRAAASTTTTPSTNNQPISNFPCPWSCYSSTATKNVNATKTWTCQNDHEEVVNVSPNYLSWRLNVPAVATDDRPSLFQYQ